MAPDFRGTCNKHWNEKGLLCDIHWTTWLEELKCSPQSTGVTRTWPHVTFCTVSANLRRASQDGKVKNAASHPEAEAGFRLFPLVEKKELNCTGLQQGTAKKQQQGSHLPLLLKLTVTILVTSVNGGVTGVSEVLSGDLHSAPVLLGYFTPSTCLICSLFSLGVQLFKLLWASWKRNVS